MRLHRRFTVRNFAQTTPLSDVINIRLIMLETVHLIPLQVMHAVGTALEPADDDGPLRPVDVIPAQIAGL